MPWNLPDLGIKPRYPALTNGLLTIEPPSKPIAAAAAAAAQSLQSCPTLCDPIDGSPPGSPVPGILQARTLEWVASSFPNAWKWKVKVKSLSCVRLLVTPWTAAYQASPSMWLSRQEYWSGVPLPSPVLGLYWASIFSMSFIVVFDSNWWRFLFFLFSISTSIMKATDLLLIYLCCHFYIPESPTFHST